MEYSRKFVNGHTVHTSPEPERSLGEALIRCADAPLTLAVSGGQTPAALFRLLVSGACGTVDWKRIRLFQVDERCVPPDHPQSNWRMLLSELIGPTQAKAWRMKAEEKDGAEDYEALLRRVLPLNEEGWPVFNLVLLGMGDDGHTASLFSGTKALEEDQRAVVRNYVPQLDSWRVTLTFPVLQAAEQRCFLARGAVKRVSFIQALRGELPAGKMAPATWYVDEELGEALQEI